jgi:hypothetical protein
MDLIALQDREVKKHVGAVHVSGRLSLMQRKVSNVLLMNAYDDMLGKDLHRIAVKDLAEIVGFDSNNREVLKDAVKSLMSLVLEWNILDDRGREGWEAMPMLAYAAIKGGYCAYAYPERLKEKFYNPEIYARISISMQRKFSSGYALTLHENLVRFRKVGSSGWLAVETLKTLLGVEGNAYYTEFRRFNSKILKPAVREINANSDIKVEAEVRRETRRVSAVRFLVSDTHQLSLFRDHPLYERMLDFGLTEKQAKDALQAHESDYIRENLDIVEGLLEAGRIKSTLAAASVDALRNDYRKHPARREQGQERRKADAVAERAARLAAAAEAECRQALEMEFEARQLDAAIAALSETERQHLERAFIAGLEDRSLAGALILLEFFRRSGFESAGVRCAFRTFQRDRLMKGQKPDEAAFARFVEEREA